MFSLQGKKALIIGIANENSIAYGCAKALRAQGADLAITHWQRALDVFQAVKDRQGEGDTLSGMGWVFYLMGDYEQALTYIQQALVIYGRGNERLHRIGINVGDIGVIRAAQGAYAEAVANLHESLGIADAVNATSEKSYKGGYLATVYMLAGDDAAAAEAARTAVQYDVAANRHVVAAVHGVALARLGRVADAISAFEQAVAYADSVLKYTSGLYTARYARALALAGLAYLRGDDPEAALDEYGRAKALCSTAGVLQMQRLLVELLDDGERLASVRRLLGGT